MYTMTEEQARAYVLAGFFPRRDDVAAITDLQDAYGHLSTQFTESLLENAETAGNAEKLFRLIWAAATRLTKLRTIKVVDGKRLSTMLMDVYDAHLTNKAYDVE